MTNTASGPTRTAAPALDLRGYGLVSGPLPPKQVGTVLGIAVLLDAFLVRLVLLPAWLTRVLPDIRSPTADLHPADLHHERKERPTMCHAVTCTACGKTTWAGCGRHVERALAGVPLSRRCPGHASPERPGRPRRLGRLGRFFGGRS